MSANWSIQKNSNLLGIWVQALKPGPKLFGVGPPVKVRASARLYPIISYIQGLVKKKKKIKISKKRGSRKARTKGSLILSEAGQSGELTNLQTRSSKTRSRSYLEEKLGLSSSQAGVVHKDPTEPTTKPDDQDAAGIYFKLL